MRSSTSSSSAGRFGVRLAAVFSAICAALAALHGIDRYADVPAVGEKLSHLERSPERYDTLFVGSSYVYREFDPALFDAISEAAGDPVRSFNLGIPGMDPPETYWLLDRALALSNRRWRLVLIELDSLRSRVRPANSHTRRFENWHDLPRTLASIRAVAEGTAPRGKKLKDIGTHTEAFFRRLAMAGRWRGLIGIPLSSERSAGNSPSLGARNDGFVSLDEERATLFAMRRDWYDAFEEDRYGEKLAALKAGVESEDGESAVTDFEIDLLRSAIERARVHGARVVLVVPPCLATRASLILRAKAIEGVRVLAFNDPERYPELYDPALRFDVGHLNARGAERFTQLLGEAVFAR